MECKYCNRIAKSNNSNKQHEIRCHSNPSKLIQEYKSGGAFVIRPTPCEFCSKEYESKIGLSNHSRRCPKNPNRILEVQTAESNVRRQATRLTNGTLYHSEETKKKLSVSMKRAVDNNPEAYSSSNRGRTKQIEYNGVKFQGQWELDFYKWAEVTGLSPRRPTEGFKYEWNGTRTYFPDFYIESLATYVEVKGYETDRDRAKWLQFPKKLCIIKEQEIKDIRKGIFKGLQ